MRAASTHWRYWSRAVSRATVAGGAVGGAAIVGGTAVGGTVSMGRAAALGAGNVVAVGSGADAAGGATAAPQPASRTSSMVSISARGLANGTAAPGVNEYGAIVHAAAHNVDGGDRRSGEGSAAILVGGMEVIVGIAGGSRAAPTDFMMVAAKLVGRTAKLVGRAAKLVGRTAKLVGRAAKLVGHAAKLVGHAAKLVGHAAKLVGRAANLVGHTANLVGHTALFVGGNAGRAGNENAVRAGRAWSNPHGAGVDGGGAAGGGAAASARLVDGDHNVANLIAGDELVPGESWGAGHTNAGLMQQAREENIGLLDGDVGARAAVVAVAKRH